MSIPTRMTILHSDNSITVESFGTLSYGTEVNTRQKAVDILKERLIADPKKYSVGDRLDWLKTAQLISFYGYIIGISEIQEKTNG